MNRAFVFALLLTVLLGSLTLACSASVPDKWSVALGASGTGGLMMEVGATPNSVDDFSGIGAVALDLDGHRGAYCLTYRQQDNRWLGETGFYSSEYRAPFTPGQSKRWEDIYLWGQGISLATAYRVPFHTGTGISDSWVPSGYRGHLVLDYVPAECNWDGPTEFWLDLGKPNDLTLPTIVTTDPLQGTRMHLTVYAPVPEPSSLAALATGLAGVAGFVFRRRRV